MRVAQQPGQRNQSVQIVGRALPAVALAAAPALSFTLGQKSSSRPVSPLAARSSCSFNHCCGLIAPSGSAASSLEASGARLKIVLLIMLFVLSAPPARGALFPCGASIVVIAVLP